MVSIRFDEGFSKVLEIVLALNWSMTFVVFVLPYIPTTITEIKCPFISFPLVRIVLISVTDSIIFIKLKEHSFYYNEDDGNLFVPKPNLFGMRWTVRWVTFNWAHPIAQIFLFALITLILLPVIYNAFGIRLGKQ